MIAPMTPAEVDRALAEAWSYLLLTHADAVHMHTVRIRSCGLR